MDTTISLTDFLIEVQSRNFVHMSREGSLNHSWRGLVTLFMTSKISLKLDVCITLPETQQRVVTVW